MAEQHETRSADPGEVTGAFAAARGLLEGAEQEAERTRATADRYARQRELEAELLVGKARRLLAAAEEKAALIIAAARAQAPVTAEGAALATDGLGATGSVPSTDPEVLDLDALSGAPVSVPGAPVPTELDRMLASAIAHAVESRP